MSICPADSVRPATQHVMYFDLLNVCAAIGVVYLHCNGMVHTFREGGNWVIGLAIECIFYWSVPIFFMLTGATLIGYRRRYDTRTYLIRRVLRVIVPFVAWSLIWYLLLPSVNDGSINAVDFLKKFLSGQIISIYWFFIP